MPTKVYDQNVKWFPVLPGSVWNRATKTHSDVMVRAPIFVNGDKQIVLSAEENGDAYFADYYGEFAPQGYKGYPWVDPALEQWAADHGCFWEWRDGGSLVLYRV
jgi:hypothetical protein